MPRPFFFRYLRLLGPLIAFFGLVACSGVEIVGANETRVWIRSPVLSIGSSNNLAQEHCAKFGKSAVLESDMSVSEGTTSILVYACN